MRFATETRLDEPALLRRSSATVSSTRTSPSHQKAELAAVMLPQRVQLAGRQFALVLFNAKLTTIADCRTVVRRFLFKANAEVDQNRFPASVRYSFAGGAHKHGADLEKRVVS